jgi:hypothetical protein
MAGARAKALSSPPAIGAARVRLPSASLERGATVTQAEGASFLEERIVVRLVPVSSSQIRALESLERALFGLAADFQRDFGLDSESELAGGLYRLWSTLGMITTYWKEEAEELSTVAGRQAALERIRDDEHADSGARMIAAEALR